jgi:hypothetical protein
MISADIGGAFIAGKPNREYGFSFMVNGTAHVGGIINYTEHDKADIQALIDDFNTLETCLNEDPASCASETYRWYDQATNEFTYDPNNELDSNVNVKAALITETGISLAHLFDIQGYPVAVGVTPKYVTATVIDYEENIDSAEEDDSDSDDYMKDYNDFNLDVGLTVGLPDGVYAGFVIKNLIPKSYDTYNNICRGGETPNTDGYCNKTKTGDTVDIDPHVRSGISETTDWYVVSTDLDLTENDALNLDEGSRYLGFGGELNSLDWLSLRVGYRFDLADNDHNVASIGFGLSPGWFNLDLAVAGSSNNEIGASAQLSLQF